MIITQTNNEIISLSLHLIEVKVLALALEYALNGAVDEHVNELWVDEFLAQQCKKDGITLDKTNASSVLRCINVLLKQRADQIVGGAHAALKAYKDSGTVQ